MTVRRAAVIVNPISGSARRGRALERFTEALAAGGVEVVVRPTERAGHGADLAAEASAAGVDVVVAAGGDGTVNDVVRGLLRAGGDAALGVLPLGTSNLVARELDIPLAPVEAAGALLRGSPGPMDVAEANGRVAVACVGVGWDAEVVRRLSQARRGHIGWTTYLGPGLGAAMGYRFPRIRVHVDGGEVVEGVLALFLNARPYARFFEPAPGARSDDGLLDAVVMLRGGRGSLPRWTWKALRKSLHEGDDVRLVRGARFRVEGVEGDGPVPYQIDGDVGAETPVGILVRPGAIQVIRPPRRNPDKDEVPSP